MTGRSSLATLGAWAALLAYGALIVYLSHQPGDTQAMESLQHVDKIAHVVEFAIFSALLGFALSRTRVRRVHSLGVCGSLLFACSDEWHQSFIPYREASTGDLLADAVGVGLGTLLVAWLRRRRTPQPERVDAGPERAATPPDGRPG